MKTEVSEENIKYWLDLHGHVPWTVTIADFLSKDIPWDKEDIIKTLQRAQATIDGLTEQLKEKNT
jgi:hypothetical protein